MEDTHAIAFTAAAVVTVLSVCALGLISLKHLKIMRRHPRVNNVPRREYRRFLHTLPEYRATVFPIRVLSSVLASSTLLQVFLMPSNIIVDSIVTALCLVGLVGVWVVDRRLSSERETRPARP